MILFYFYVTLVLCYVQFQCYKTLLESIFSYTYVPFEMNKNTLITEYYIHGPNFGGAHSGIFVGVQYYHFAPFDFLFIPKL